MPESLKVLFIAFFASCIISYCVSLSTFPFKMPQSHRSRENPHKCGL